MSNDHPMNRPLTLWWIKKDFRLADNPALTAALAQDERVLAVFFFEPDILAAEETSAFHVAAWCEALTALRNRLAPHGGEVLVLHMGAVAGAAYIHEKQAIRAIFSHEEIGSEVTYRRDRAFGEWTAANGVDWHELPQTGVFRGTLDRDRRAARWKAFMRADNIPPVPDPGQLQKLSIPSDHFGEKNLPSEALLPQNFGHPLRPDQLQYRQAVSEPAAEATLQSFLYERGQCYSGGISSPNLAFTCGSRLSVHLAWGTLTARQVYAATEARQAEVKEADSEEAKAWKNSLRSFKSRLHWRDHFIQRLETESGMEFMPLNPAYAELPTPGDEYLERWLAGQTGWPLVDACMRCAASTGFLNFRMRAFITSVAVHSLRIDWRKILYPTARLWADYEPGIHISQTQMQAGVVGINQLRIYSPDKQLADHDREATFVKAWVPELREVEPKAILRHHLSPISDYPTPPVDWRENSRAMKADYYAIKTLPESRALAEEVYARHGSRKGPRRPPRKKTTTP
ncbi:deoxyribodipyrimidine photo-lyase [Lewinella aquimaris]|uniref:Deoxyribodipyrimidine photo-lyase n=1 Tax=Neolewinella aquimaris TaxID=1835722 RepID=A0A840E4G2_9BACT|nr:FAD-binding domain-containing protein [Neolewinella aquimaris]MBB4078843.1 deoxyribodipyrimidine photo-lyase [Neolewinella aquimaris]